MKRKRIGYYLLKNLQRQKKHTKDFEKQLKQASEDGYGVTLPTMEEFAPTEPEIIKQNNFYGVRMKATAPSYHIIRIDMETEFAPLIGSEFHSQQLLKDLNHAYNYMTVKRYGKHNYSEHRLHEVLKESIRYKMKAVPESAKKRMRQTIERMVNEGDRGLVTFII